MNRNLYVEALAQRQDVFEGSTIPATVTITVTATRADDTAEVEHLDRPTNFTVEVEPEPEPVPVLPLLGQLLLALGLLAGGVR